MQRNSVLLHTHKATKHDLSVVVHTVQELGAGEGHRLLEARVTDRWGVLLVPAFSHAPGAYQTFTNTTEKAEYLWPSYRTEKGRRESAY